MGLEYHKKQPLASKRGITIDPIKIVRKEEKVLKKPSVFNSPPLSPLPDFPLLLRQDADIFEDNKQDNISNDDKFNCSEEEGEIMNKEDLKKFVGNEEKQLDAKSQKIAKLDKNRRKSRNELKFKKLTYLGYPRKVNEKKGRIMKDYKINIEFLDQDDIERKCTLRYGDPEGKKKPIAENKIGTFTGEINHPRWWETNYLPLNPEQRKEKYFKTRLDYGLDE